MNNSINNLIIEALIKEKEEIDNDYLITFEEIKKVRGMGRRAEEALKHMPKELRRKFGTGFKKDIVIFKEAIAHNNRYLDTGGVRKVQEGRARCNDNKVDEFKLQAIIDEKRGGSLYIGY